MKKKNNEDQELKNIMKQKSLIKAPKEAHQKSLRTFQKGLETNITTKHAKPKINKHLFASIATSAAVIGIMLVLLLDTNLFTNNDPGSIPSTPSTTDEDEEVEDNSVQDGKSIHLKEVGQDEEFIIEVLERPIFDAMEYNPRFKPFDENKFVLDLPPNWSIDETREEESMNVHVSGDETEEIQFILFDEKQTEEQLFEYAEELMNNYNQTEQTVIPDASLQDKINNEHFPFSRYEALFPFHVENAEVYAFKDKAADRYYELFLTDFFNRQMIYVADLPLNNKETWQTSWELLASLAPKETPFLLLDETEVHTTYERPLQGEAIVAEGAIKIDVAEIELYVNEELGMTSYIESGTETEKMDEALYTEWRFYDRRYSDFSFYSYGMLKEGFPLEQGYQAIFNKLEMDPASFEEPDGDIPHHYSYGDNDDGNNYNGYIEFFEVEESWYFVRVHEDYRDYNGGIFYERLRLLKDEAEHF